MREQKKGRMAQTPNLTLEGRLERSDFCRIPFTTKRAIRFFGVGERRSSSIEMRFPKRGARVQPTTSAEEFMIKPARKEEKM